MVIQDVAALLGECLLAAVGVGDFGDTGEGVVAAGDGVLEVLLGFALL